MSVSIESDVVTEAIADCPRCLKPLPLCVCDDVVPIDNSIRYAREHRATLHAIDSDHRMTANIQDIVRFLKIFLDNLED